MAACPACGSANPDGARFCNGCAAMLGTAATAAAREERRVVTVLFADLAGFTARSETLDPEDVRAFLLPYYDVLTSEITRHGGHVDRFLGDGVMALFGAPTAHEDDPERAVRAALRILERIPGLGLDLHVRLGVNTGPVLFAAGSGGERDDAVTGDAVNTAARLQAVAPTAGVARGDVGAGPRRPGRSPVLARPFGPGAGLDRLQLRIGRLRGGMPRDRPEEPRCPGPAHLSSPSSSSRGPYASLMGRLCDSGAGAPDGPGHSRSGIPSHSGCPAPDSATGRGHPWAAGSTRGRWPPPAAPQQMRGSCSPTSMSTIRSLPTMVRMVTMPG